MCFSPKLNGIFYGNNAKDSIDKKKMYTATNIEFRHAGCTSIWHNSQRQRFSANGRSSKFVSPIFRSSIHIQLMWQWIGSHSVGCLASGSWIQVSIKQIKNILVFLLCVSMSMQLRYHPILKSWIPSNIKTSILLQSSF